MSRPTNATTTHQTASPVPLDTLRPSAPSEQPTTTTTTSRDVPAPPPKPPILKLLSTGLSFLTAGVNDGSLGALLPYLLRSYSLTTAQVTALYAATLAGWLAAALTSTHLGQRLRLGTVLALGAGTQTAAHLLRCVARPPWGVFVASCFVVCLGQGWQDTFGNTFVASQMGEGDGGESSSVHRWLGFIHAMYMAGCLVAPFGAASIAATGRWWLFYAVPLGLGVVNLGLVLVAFRDSLGLEGRGGGRRAQAEVEVDGKKSASSLIRDALGRKNVWLLGLFFFFYLGVGVTAGGWVVEYLVDVRNGDLAQMGYVPAGFSGGCLLGRILLPEPTHRFGEKRMVLLYCVLCLGFQLLFWL